MKFRSSIQEDLFKPREDMLNIDPFTCINSLTYIANPNHMSLLVDLSFKKAYGEYLKELLYPIPLYHVLKSKLDINIGHHNLLHSTLFVLGEL